MGGREDEESAGRWNEELSVDESEGEVNWNEGGREGKESEA